jgi:hypothetical protein
MFSGGDLAFVLRPLGKQYNSVGEFYVEGSVQGKMVEATVNYKVIETLISGKVGNPELNTEDPRPDRIEIPQYVYKLNWAYLEIVCRCKF